MNSKKLSQLFKKELKGGMDKEVAFVYIGECMDEDNQRVFTNSDLYCSMENVLQEVLKALKDQPQGLAAIKSHFKIVE